MMPPSGLWPGGGTRAYELIVFDLRTPGAMGRLVAEGAAWRGCAHIEILDSRHAVLVVHAGGAGGAYGAGRRAA